MIDVAKMKEAAQRATRGVWLWWSSNSHLRLTAERGQDGGILHGARLLDGCMTVVVSNEDAAHIAVNHPDAVLALIARNEALERFAASCAAMAGEQVDGAQLAANAKAVLAGQGVQQERAAAPLTVPGWQWVPVEPTDAMLFATGAIHLDKKVARIHRDAWARMLAAAPQQAAPAVRRGVTPLSERMPIPDDAVCFASGDPDERLAAGYGPAPVAALDDAQITAVWQTMPGGPAGWLKSFGFLQFARAILDEAGATPEGAQESARYRWLRDGNNGNHVIVELLGFDAELVLTEYDADEAIDAAILAKAAP